MRGALHARGSIEPAPQEYPPVPDLSLSATTSRVRTWAFMVVSDQMMIGLRHIACCGE
jgi:hypothetical protein